MPHEKSLDRFLDAQNTGKYGAVLNNGMPYQTALTEINAGRKATHWIWYVFPQYKGLGRSDINAEFSIQSAEEAKAYLQDPTLRHRLLEITRAVLYQNPKNSQAIHHLFNGDEYKFFYSMTLFYEIAYTLSDQEALECFQRALWLGGNRGKLDWKTLKFLEREDVEVVRTVPEPSLASRPLLPRAVATVAAALPHIHTAPVRSQSRSHFSYFERFFQWLYNRFHSNQFQQITVDTSPRWYWLTGARKLVMPTLTQVTRTPSIKDAQGDFLQTARQGPPPSMTIRFPSDPTDPDTDRTSTLDHKDGPSVRRNLN